MKPLVLDFSAAKQQPDDIVSLDDGWDGGLVQREELPTETFEERTSSASRAVLVELRKEGLINELKEQGRIDAEKPLTKKIIEEQGSSVSSLSGADDEELSVMDIEMTMSRPSMAAPSPLMSRGKAELKKLLTLARARHHKGPSSARLRERSVNLARPRTGANVSPIGKRQGASSKAEQEQR